MVTQNFNYSKNTEDVKMFIGQQDESSINFARKKGSKIGRAHV
jgi:hypothetical protein